MEEQTQTPKGNTYRRQYYQDNAVKIRAYQSQYFKKWYRNIKIHDYEKYRAYVDKCNAYYHNKFTKTPKQKQVTKQVIIEPMPMVVNDRPFAKKN
jgi:hypothetical protein